MMVRYEKFLLNIAEFKIEITLYPTERKQDYFSIKRILSWYKGFIINSGKAHKTNIDYHIKIVEQKNPYFLFNPLDKKKFINLYQFKEKHKTITYYHISRSHFEVVLIDALQKLFANNFCFFLHSSAIIIDNKVYIFLGKEGAGKSTIVRLLKPYGNVLADDSLIVKKKGNDFYVYQTPFIEKESWIKKGSEGFKIDRVFFLNKSSYCSMSKLNQKKDIIKLLKPQFWFKWMDKTYLTKQESNLSDFISTYDNFFILHFPKNRKKLLNFFLIS